jgi:PhnB protein
MKRTRRTAKPATQFEQLDNAVEKIMADRRAPLPRVNSRIAEIMRIAADLRALPREDFKERLKEELLSRAQAANASAAAISEKDSQVPRQSPTANACLVVRDTARAIEFYQRAFGATELMRLADPAGNVMHAQIKIGDTPIDIAPELLPYNRSPESLGGSSVPIALNVEDVDSFAVKAIRAGAKVIIPVADQFYGDRAGRLEDPFGHLWIVSTHKEDLTPYEMARRAEKFMKQQEPVAQTEKVESLGAERPEGFYSITPYLQVKGAGKLIEFLKKAFDAEEIFRVPRGNQIAHAQLRIEGSMIEVADAIDKYKPNRTAIWLFVDDTDAIYARAIKAGAISIHEPMDQDYGERSASVRDPFGNHWYIATPFEDSPPPPEGLHSVTPYLHPKSAPEVIEFMKQAFDAEEVFRAQDPAGTVHHAKVRIGDSIIAMGEAHGPYQPMPLALHLYVTDTDLAYRRALQAGATSIDEPVHQSYGDRYAGVKDPFDNVWYLATVKTKVEASESGKEYEPQSPVRPVSIMPFMYCEDPDDAFEFYRKVFGATEVHRVAQPSGKASHIQMAIGPTHVMLRDATTDDLAEYRAKGFASTPHSLGGTPLHLYIYVGDADAAFKRAMELGSKLVDPMADKEWGDRCGGVQDPFGHIWYIATPLPGGSR